MIAYLGTDELFYLLDNCLRGSHLRSGVIERFVDEFYLKLSEEQRMKLFEWAVRLSYAWLGGKEKYFEPSDSACGKDVIFMKRYHPENQYEVTLVDGNKPQMTVRAFLMDGKYYVGCQRYCGEEFITDVKKVELPEWERYKQSGVDYDRNIL